MTERILLVEPQAPESIFGGRQQLASLNREVLARLFGDKCLSYNIPVMDLRSLSSVIKRQFGYLDGLSNAVVAEVLEIVEQENVKQVFIDGSNLGKLAQAIKKRFPAIRIITFCHNVESRFFWGAFRSKPSLRTFGVAFANYFAERAASRFSDVLLCLTRRDADQFRKIYGARKIEITPLCIKDDFEQTPDDTAPPLEPGYALFVGGTFYANVDGVRWFIKHVMPRVELKLCIAGQGFEQYRQELEAVPGVKVLGRVGNLGPLYRHAAFAIAPIFDGSGMKTKVSEALMYGKPILATSEAVVGYEDVIDQMGAVCATAEQFVEAINLLVDKPVKPYETRLRSLYLDHYSMIAAQRRMSKVFSVMDTPR